MSRLCLRRLILICLTTGLVTASCGSYQPSAPNVGPSWQAESLPGVPGGFRATAFDSTRNSLWIVTRFFRRAGEGLATLTRFNIASKSSTGSLLEVPANGFIRGSVALDSKGFVWMTWGRVLLKYDPDTNTSRSWPLPNPPGIVVRSEDPALDGNAVALAVGTNNEVWVVANSVDAIFGFDSTRAVWDRTVPLSLSPTLFTRVGIMGTGQLTVNGVLKGGTPVLAVVNPVSGVVSSLQPRVRTYVLAGTDSAVYEDDSFRLGRLAISGGDFTTISPALPVAGDPALAVDGLGNVWFSMAAYRSVGVGKIDPISASVTPYPLPQAASISTGAIPCPAPPCHSAIFDPKIQSIVVDSNNNIWVTTSVPGVGGDASFAPSASALYELPAS